MSRLLIHFIRRLYQPAFWLSKKISRKGLYPFLDREFSSIGASQRVLCVGAGGRVGALLMEHSKARGFEVVQLDIDPKRAPKIVADICQWSQPNAFDVVVASEVLEHVHSPPLALANIHTTLTKPGRLILSTPFVFPIHDQPADYYRFTNFGLEFLLRDFHSVQIRERNSWPEAILVLAARTLKTREGALKAISPSFLLLAVLCYPVAWLLGKILPSPFMTTGYNATAMK